MKASRDTVEGRAVISGMAAITPLADDLDGFFGSLIAGRSGVTPWKFFDTSCVYAKVGGDLSDYDVTHKLDALKKRLPPTAHRKIRRLVKKASFPGRLALLCAADAWLDAGLVKARAPGRAAVVAAGHNLNNNYLFSNTLQFTEEPEYVEPLLPLHGLDTDIAATVSEALGTRGTIYTVGGACASGNLALRAAVQEVRSGDHDLVLVVGAPYDFSPADLQGMALMGAISINGFNDEPPRASRPYDMDREGFVPAHGCAALVVESLPHALDRGARTWAELLGVTSTSDACHLPSPSEEGQVRTMTRLLGATGIDPTEVDYISAHATSTPLGDVTEVRSIKAVFGDHARELKINATKSMTGHTMWSAPLVETVAALLQMKHGILHPSINIDRLDPEVDLDVCAGGPVSLPVQVLMKNAFGFGGINSCALYRRLDQA